MVYTPITDKKILSVIFTITILVGGSVGILFLTNTIQKKPELDDPDEPKKIVPVQISSFLMLDKSVFYKGEKLDGQLALDVDQNITITGLRVSVRDLNTSRVGTQLYEMNETMEIGTNLINISLSPGFPIEGFVPIIDHTYQIFNHQVLYLHNNTIKIHEESSSIEFEGKLYEKIDQLENYNWTITSSGNNSYIKSANKYFIDGSNGSLVFEGEIDSTGFTSIDINSSGINFVGNLSYQLNSGDLTPLASYSFSKGSNAWSNFDKIPIGNFQGLLNVKIFITFQNLSDFVINFRSTTQKVPVYTVIASNNWQGFGEDGLSFRTEEFYIEEVSKRFENTFNMTLIPVAKVDFEFSNSTNLIEIIEVAKLAVGQKLSLTNSTWQDKVGVSLDNMGADLMLVFTNRTMDNLGAVFATIDGPLNMGIHARGTLFTANLRLLSSFSDNLIQHEVSHIFGAPDRWTDSDDVSVMTKSQPNLATADILSGNFWLLLTNWLDADIQTMAEYIPIYS